MLGSEKEDQKQASKALGVQAQFPNTGEVRRYVSWSWESLEKNIHVKNLQLNWF